MRTPKRELTGQLWQKSLASPSVAYNLSRHQNYADITTPSEPPTKNWYVFAMSHLYLHLVLVLIPTRTPNPELPFPASPSATSPAASAHQRWTRDLMISSQSSSNSTAAKKRRVFGASTGFESTNDQDWYIRLPITTHVLWLITFGCLVLISMLISLSASFEAETRLVSTDLLPVGGVSLTSKMRMLISTGSMHVSVL